MNSRTNRPFAGLSLVILLLGVGMCVLTEWHAYQANGQFGFPLDDAWIHLQFAKNLHDHAAFSYYRNEMVTSGSTSPLYTFLLAAGFFFSSNEFLLSYSLGLAFFTLSAIVLYRLSVKIFNSVFVASGSAFLLLFEPRLEWVALSGMETTLFLFVLIAAAYCYAVRQPVGLGVYAGLAIWIRPDAILFLVILAIDAAYRRYGAGRHLQARKPSKDDSWLLQAGVIAAAVGVAYAGFNIWLSGSIFPNTYSAKIRYYSAGAPDFLGQVYGFLTDGHLRFFSVFVAVGVVSVLSSVLRRRADDLLVSLLWSVGLFLAYWKNLPYLYQEGRYLMPILPFVILLGLRGVTTVLEAGRKFIGSPGRQWIAAALTGLVVPVFGIQFAAASWAMRESYAEYCRYIGDRQVRTAKWLRDHLAGGSVVATHDVGAIAFYSGMRIVDMVGLVSPEMIENIGSLEKLMQYLVRKKVTHLALLRNWFEVVNENPVFQTDESHPEIMEVFPFDPTRCHFTPQIPGRMTETAAHYLSVGNANEAGPLLERSLQIDPQSSKTHCLLGRAFLAVGNLQKAAAEVQTALRLHPQNWDAQSTAAEISARMNKPDEAISTLEELVGNNPSYANGYRLLAEVYQSSRRDTARALQYFRRYNEILRGAQQ